jgi:trigger factor
MKVAVEELGSCKRKLSVEETAEVVQAAWESAMSRVQRQARLPGFRRGKVPRTMVRLHFGDDVRQEVARQLIPDVYRQAVSETKLRPVEEPELQDVRLEEGAPLSFQAVVEIKPAIALGSYTGITVAHRPVPFREEEVEEALNALREQHAEFRAVERAADLEDLVIVDYTLVPDGADPRSESGYGFVVGRGQVLKEIEEAVIGLAPGSDRQVRLRFPDSHPSEALRGRGGEARVAVREVKEKILPPLDDDFARALGPFDGLEALRAEIRKDLEGRRERENRRTLEDAVVDALLAAHPFEVPEALVLRQVGHLVEHARERVRRQGVDPDKLPWDYAKLLEELRPGAEKAVRRTLLLEAIAEQEGLLPSDADVEAEVERLAQAAQRPAAALRRLMEERGDLDALRFSLREARTLDFLIARAQVTS